MAQAIKLVDLKINDVISLNTYGVGALNNIVNGVYLGTYSGKALRNPQVAATNHANIYPSIPIDPLLPVINNYTKYNYLQIQLTDSSIVEIGEPWIIPSSVSRLDRGTVVVVISDFDIAKLKELSDLLDTHDYLNRTISVN